MRALPAPVPRPTSRTILQHRQWAYSSLGHAYGHTRPHPHEILEQPTKAPGSSLWLPAPTLIGPHGFSKAPRWSHPEHRLSFPLGKLLPPPRSSRGCLSLPLLRPQNKCHFCRRCSLVLPCHTPSWNGHSRKVFDPSCLLPTRIEAL